VRYVSIPRGGGVRGGRLTTSLDPMKRTREAGGRVKGGGAERALDIPKRPGNRWLRESSRPSKRMDSIEEQNQKARKDIDI